MAASLIVAKKVVPTEATLSYPATTAYKQWVWKKIRASAGGGSLQWLVDEMKRRAKPELMAIVDQKGRPMYETLSTATLSLLLGPEGTIPPPSNSKLLPAINKALNIAPPPVCDPTDELAQVTDRFRARWAQLTATERKAILALLGD